ncbi:MAG TPA: hypothetical protein VNO21_05935 [Polyangiaceae bacterium]|nr:hypothetical protein [Polyangiaceae bacterium]
MVDVATEADYYEVVARLNERGFQVCTDEGAPLCRLVYSEIRVDISATASTAIGPTNRWYRDAIANAASYSVEAGVEVLGITPMYFLATKLEAFQERGGGDYQASHDLEDVLAVMAGLPGLRGQIASEKTAVAIAVRRELIELRAREAFIDAVPGHFDGDAAGQARANKVLDWLHALPALPV